MKVLTCLFALLFMALSSAVFSADVKERFGEWQEYHLENGLRVIHRSQPGHLRTGLGLVVDVGLRDFSCERQAAPHLLEHLFFEGTSRYSANELRQRVRRKAGKANGFTFYEDTLYSIDIHEAHTEFAIEHLFHMLTESDFDSAAYGRAVRAIEAERGVARSYLRSLLDGKKSVLEQTISRAYKDLPIDCVKKAIPSVVSLEEIVSIREQYYQPEKMTLIVLGNYDRDKLRKSINKTFGTLANSGGVTPASVALMASKTKKEAVVEYRDPSNVEADLFMVIPSVGYSHEDSHVIQIISDYLDEELFKVVRNNLGLGYTPRARYRSESGIGFISAHVQTTGQWVDKAEASFLSVYQGLKEEGIPPERLAQLINTKVLSIESEEKTVLKWLDLHRKSRLKSKDFDRLSAFRAITPQKVEAVLEQHFPQTAVIGVLKPRPAQMALLHIVFIMLGAMLAGVVLIRLKRHYCAKKS